MKAIVLGSAPAPLVARALDMARGLFGCDHVILLHPDDKPRPPGADRVLLFHPPLSVVHGLALPRNLPERHAIAHILLAWDQPGWGPPLIRLYLHGLFPNARLWLLRADGTLTALRDEKSRRAARRREPGPMRVLVDARGLSDAYWHRLQDVLAILVQDDSTNIHVLAPREAGLSLGEQVRSRRADLVHTLTPVSVSALDVPIVRQDLGDLPPGDGEVLVVPSIDAAERASRIYGMRPDRIFVAPIAAEAGWPEPWNAARAASVWRQAWRMTLALPPPPPSPVKHLVGDLAREWWGPRSRRGPAPRADFILRYHHVLEESPAGHENSIRDATTLERFRDQLDAIASWADVVPLAKILEPPGSRSRVALTFDGGSRDHVEWIVPLLGVRRLPATFFLVADWCDGLREEVLASVPPERSAFSRHATWAAWKEAVSPLVELGTMTVSHARLSALDDELLAREMAGGASRLKSATGCRASFLAFPYGGVGDYDARAPRIAASSGFQAALTTVEGPLFPAQNRWALPRVTPGQASGGELRGRLESMARACFATSDWRAS